MTNNHKQRRWTISKHKDGDHVVLYEYGFKARLASAALMLLDEFDHHVTRHWLCGSGLPEKVFNLNIGKRDYDEEYDILDSSLGMRLYRVHSDVWLWLDSKCDREEIMRVPITAEQSRVLWPEMAWLDEDDE